MYSKTEVDENIAIAELPPTESEWYNLLKEAESIGDTGCRQCRLCVGWYLKKSLCPADIDIPFIMTMIHFRNRYGLSSIGEEKWRKEAEKCKNCIECKKCEQACPYNLEILKYIRQASIS
jgi:predicted aldo/keto reductase-like oxidoreductase